jgi:alkylhydroperoxidase family enzyme
MAHIEPRDPRAAGLFVRLVYWVARRRFGRVPVPLGVMAHNRAVLAATASFELGFERARELDPRLELLVVLKTATLIGCRFCIDIGAALARGQGVAEAALLDLPVYENSPHFSALEKRALDYAVAMTATPVEVPRPLFEELRAALGVPALVELTAAIAWENHRARFNHAVGATEEGYSSNTVCLLPSARRARAASGDDQVHQPLPDGAEQADQQGAEEGRLERRDAQAARQRVRHLQEDRVDDPARDERE